MMKQYKVTGMSCAACSARVEKAVSALDGVTACSVNLLTNSMQVEGDATDVQITDAVEKAGYGIQMPDKKELPKSETTNLMKRLILSLVFLLPLMYVSMGHSMFGFPLPLKTTTVALLQMLLSAVVLVINKHFFINGFKSTVHGSPNMDALVALGSGASFIYSVFVDKRMANYEFCRQM